jgi:capsid assembly protease
MYPHIMSEIARTPWAIAPAALRGIVTAVNDKLDASDYSKFHGAEPDATKAITAQLGAAVPGSRMSFVRDGIGALQINGPIVPRADVFTDISGLASIDRLTAEFRALEANPDVRHILLVIDSPGGAITGISEFAAAIDASEKPTSVYVYGMAASAAYWIASAADEIIVADTGMTGSIGVVLTLWKKAEDQIEIVSSQSPEKRPDPETDEGAKQLRAMVDGLADVFISTVVKNRSVSKATVIDKFGRGGMVLPTDAIRAGMVDGQMTLSAYLGALINSEKPTTENNGEVFDTPAADGGKQNEKVENTARGAKTMTLTEFLKEHPEAAAEIDAIKAKATKDGKLGAEKAIGERNARAAKILASETYPTPIKAIAAAVLEGTKTAEHLDIAVDVFDSLKAKEQIDGATADSNAAPATPGQNVTPLSRDGVLRSAADIDAEAAAMKAGR